MTPRFTTRSLLALGALLACLAFPAALSAQGRKPPPPPKPNRKAMLEEIERQAKARRIALDELNKEQFKKAVSIAQKQAEAGKIFAEAEVLADAYLLLAGAGHDYEGHRAKAMHQIEAAVKDLNASLLKQGTHMEKAMRELEQRTAVTAKEMADATPHDYQHLIMSGPRLHAARHWLVVAQQSLAQNKKVSPLGHVDGAIKQIDAALKQGEEWHKFLQAEALRRAYILLAWGNHDYDGYRHLAMIQVHEAVKILDADIMKNGSALLKAKESVEKKLVAVVKTDLDALPEIHEIQLASDLLLKNAREWLVLVHYSLLEDKRGAAKHVHTAIVDIDLALKHGPQWKKLHEANALREAYLLLASANNDPGGHRAKAMRQIEGAVKILDESLMKEGSNMHRAMKALEKEVEVAAVLDEHLRLVSDLQFRSARDWLILVRRALAQNNQEAPLKHVDVALKELSIALKLE